MAFALEVFSPDSGMRGLESSENDDRDASTEKVGVDASSFRIPSQIFLEVGLINQLQALYR